MPKEADQQAKKFTTQKAKAGLYIYRNESFGAVASMKLFLNDTYLATTGAGSYVYLALQPGKYTIKGEAENDSVIQVDLKQGKNTFVWQEVKMGILMARNKLQVVSEKQGKEGVLESDRIKANEPEQKKLTSR